MKRQIGFVLQARGAPGPASSFARVAAVQDRLALRGRLAPVSAWLPLNHPPSAQSVSHIAARLPALQDDLLYATLSVHETLFFAAMLRLPKHKTKAEKVGRARLLVREGMPALRLPGRTSRARCRPPAC